MKFQLFLTVCITALSSASMAASGDWPARDGILNIVVPYDAGGGTDSVVRPLTTGLGDTLKIAVQISNIGGAGSAAGTNEMLNMPADGYTVLVSGTHTIGATMQGLTDGYHQLEQIAALNWDPFIVAVLSSSDIDTMAELVAAAKATPGKICLGNAGMGGATGVASIAINLDFDGAFNVTPFQGGQNLRTDVLGGRCEAGIFSQSEIAANMAQLRPLAILTDEHSLVAEFSDVPTLSEQGYEDLAVPGGSFRTIAVRAGTPDEVKQQIADAVELAYNSDTYQELMEEQGLIPAFMKLDDAQAYFDELVLNFEPIVRASGLYKDQ